MLGFTIWLVGGIFSFLRFTAFCRWYRTTKKESFLLILIVVMAVSWVGFFVGLAYYRKDQKLFSFKFKGIYKLPLILLLISFSSFGQLNVKFNLTEPTEIHLKYYTANIVKEGEKEYVDFKIDTTLKEIKVFSSYVVNFPKETDYLIEFQDSNGKFKYVQLKTGKYYSQIQLNIDFYDNKRLVVYYSSDYGKYLQYLTIEPNLKM